VKLPIAFVAWPVIFALALLFFLLGAMAWLSLTAGNILTDWAEAVRDGIRWMRRAAA